MIDSRQAKRIREHVIVHDTTYVALAFFLLSVCLIGSICDWKPASNTLLNPDSAFMLWAFKWWPHSLLSSHGPFLAPFFSPGYANLAWTTSVPALALLAAPITYFAGPVFAYNCIVTVALSANGVLAYSIARRLNCTSLAAIICSALFYFSSYTWAQLLGHLNLTVTAFALAIILITIRRYLSTIGRIKYIITAGLLLALQFGTSNEIYATLIAFGALGVLMLIAMTYASSCQRLASYQLASDVFLSILVSVALLTPYLLHMFSHPVSGLQSISSYVADPLNYVIPTISNWLMGHWFNDVSTRFIGNLTEQNAYLGLPVIILIGFVGGAFYRNRTNAFLFVMLLIVLVCSFGPRLTILGIPTIRLPWSVAEKLPLISEALPSRFGLYTSLLASILVARVISRFHHPAVLLIALAAVIFSLPNLDIYRATPVPKDSFFSSGAYRQVLPRNARVLVLPTYGFWGYQPDLWQEQANFYFDLTNGLAGKVPPGLDQFTWFYYGGTRPPNALYRFLQFLHVTGTQYILSDRGFEDPLSKLSAQLPFPQAIYGGVRVTTVSASTLSTLLDASGTKASRETCIDLADLAQYGFRYRGINPRSNRLIPRDVTNEAFIRKFGTPFPPDSPAANWTGKGYWLGFVGGHIAVGYSPVDTKIAAYLYSMFKDNSIQMFYPYPSVFIGQSSDAHSGQFLVLLQHDVGATICH